MHHHLSLVHAENVYIKSNSLWKILVLAIGIPLFLVCLALATYVYYICSKNEILKVNNYKEQNENRTKQAQHNDLGQEESIQI